jgi:cytokinesis protein
MAADKRRQAAEDAKAVRKKAIDRAQAQSTEEATMLDDLLEKLRNGDNVGRRARQRTRAGVSAPETLPVDTPVPFNPSMITLDTAGLAQNMLAALKSDGFEMFVPTSPTTPTRRHRRRHATGSDDAVSSTQSTASVTLLHSNSMTLSNNSQSSIQDSLTSLDGDTLTGDNDNEDVEDGDVTIRFD